VILHAKQLALLKADKKFFYFLFNSFVNKNNNPIFAPLILGFLVLI
jgi:hypothetical protein